MAERSGFVAESAGGEAEPPLRAPPAVLPAPSPDGCGVKLEQLGGALRPQ